MHRSGPKRVDQRDRIVRQLRHYGNVVSATRGIAPVTVVNPADPPDLTSRLISDIEALGGTLTRVRESIGRVIFGQTDVIDQALVTLLAGGHTPLGGGARPGQNRLVQTPRGV